VTRVDVPIV